MTLLRWAQLKRGGGDCTHWKYSGDVALPFVDWFWNKTASDVLLLAS